MTGRVVPLPVPRVIAPSVLRQALMAGPDAHDPVTLLMVRFLDVAGVLDDPAFVEHCVHAHVDPIDGTVLYAQVDLEALTAVSVGLGPVCLSETALRLLSSVVGLLDLAAVLPTLTPLTRAVVTHAVTEYLLALDPARVPAAEGGLR